jgi:hypothetical protein
MNVHSLDCPLLSGFLLASLFCHWLVGRSGRHGLRNDFRSLGQKGPFAGAEQRLERASGSVVERGRRCAVMWVSPQVSVQWVK